MVYLFWQSLTVLITLVPLGLAIFIGEVQPIPGLKYCVRVVVGVYDAFSAGMKVGATFNSQK